jgi:hypothetical protein
MIIEGYAFKLANGSVINTNNVDETKDEKITPKLEENDIVEEKSNMQNALDFLEI